jgi:hypothetical protein
MGCFRGSLVQLASSGEILATGATRYHLSLVSFLSGIKVKSSQVNLEKGNFNSRHSKALIRDENPTGPGFGPGPKTLIFFKFQEPGTRTQTRVWFSGNPKPEPEPKVQKSWTRRKPSAVFFYKTKTGKNKIRVQKSSVPHSSIFKFDSNFLPKIGQKDSFLWGPKFFLI